MPEVIVLLQVCTIAQASYCWGPGSIPEYSMSILWWAEWQWCRFSLRILVFPCQLSFLYVRTIFGWYGRLGHDRFSSSLCANSEIYEPYFCFLWIYVLLAILTFCYCWCGYARLIIHSFLKLYHCVHIFLLYFNSLIFPSSFLCCITYSSSILPSCWPTGILKGIFVHSRKKKYIPSLLMTSEICSYTILLNSILYQFLHITVFMKGPALHSV